MEFLFSVSCGKLIHFNAVYSSRNRQRITLPSFILRTQSHPTKESKTLQLNIQKVTGWKTLLFMRCNEKIYSNARCLDWTGRQINVLSSAWMEERYICFLQRCNCKNESENQPIHTFMNIYYLAIWILLLFIRSFKYSLLSEDAHRNVEASSFYIPHCIIWNHFS